jgi:hypothetical protein
VSAIAGLFEETERLKLRFIRAYERLYELGRISAADLDEVIDALDRMDELSKEELAAKLGKFRELDLDQGKEEARGGK